jgi:hypothetical protein
MTEETMLFLCGAAYPVFGFATLILDSHESTTKQEVPWRVFCFLLWPLPVSLFFVVLLWNAMDDGARWIADRIKGESK